MVPAPPAVAIGPILYRPRELRLALLREGRHRFAEVIAGQEAGVPRRHVLEPVLHALSLAELEDSLGALDRERRVGGDPLGEIAGRRHRGVGVCVDAVHEVDALGALGVEVLPGERQLGDVSLADDGRQTLQRADVGDDGDARLANRERRVLRSVADVARGDEIDAAAEAVTVHGRDHRLRAARRPR